MHELCCDVEQSDVPGFFHVSAGCQCQQCASNCKWRSASEGIVTCSVRNLLCHKPGFHNVSLHVLQPLGSHLRHRPDFSQPHNLKHTLVLHVLDFLGAYFSSHSIVAHGFSRPSGVNLFFGDESFLPKMDRMACDGRVQANSCDPHLLLHCPPDLRASDQVQRAIRRDFHPAPILPIVLARLFSLWPSCISLSSTVLTARLSVASSCVSMWGNRWRTRRLWPRVQAAGVARSSGFVMCCRQATSWLLFTAWSQ